MFLFCPPPLCQLLFQYPVSQSQPSSFYVGGPMVIDSMAGTENNQPAQPPAPLTPAPQATAGPCSTGPSPSSQGSETSFDCTHCGKSLRSRKNYSKHMFIHSGESAWRKRRKRKWIIWKNFWALTLINWSDVSIFTNVPLKVILRRKWCTWHSNCNSFVLLMDVQIISVKNTLHCWQTCGPLDPCCWFESLSEQLSPYC